MTNPVPSGYMSPQSRGLQRNRGQYCLHSSADERHDEAPGYEDDFGCPAEVVGTGVTLRVGELRPAQSLG